MKERSSAIYQSNMVGLMLIWPGPRGPCVTTVGLPMIFVAKLKDQVPGQRKVYNSSISQLIELKGSGFMINLSELLQTGY